MGSSVYMAAYWRYYRRQRKMGLPPSHARRGAHVLAGIWFHYIRQYEEKQK